MHLILDTRSNIHTGINTYLNNLLCQFSLLCPNLKISKYTDSINYLKKINNKVHALGEIIYEDFFMNYELRDQGCDIFHCIKNYGLPRFAKFPIVTTVHDIIPIVLRSEYSKHTYQYAYFKYNYNKTINLTDAIISISDFTTSSILKYYPSAIDKIYRIRQGCDPNFGNIIDNKNSLKVLKKYSINRDYLFVMGGAEPRKNVSMVLRLFDDNTDLIPCDLVLIGGNWGNFKISVPRKRINQFHNLQNISREELAAIYKFAKIFIFPSLYEGFGLPVLEAMACKVPVLAHNGTSIPEVAGSAALLVDMRNPHDCLVAIAKLLNNVSLRNEYIEAGYERTKLFNWYDTATQTLEVYRSVVSKK